MKGQGIICAVVVAALVGLTAQPALAAYTSIQHNLINGSPDTSYDNGVLSINAPIMNGVPDPDDSAPNNNGIDLNDPTSLPGEISNASVSLVTYLSGYDPVEDHAIFTGGEFMLQFDYAGSTGQAYAIGGPIAGAVLKVSSSGPHMSTIAGQGLFNATTVVLPGTNTWPADGLSSIDTITLTVGTNLAGFCWGANLTGVGETQYTLTPDDTAVPEPAGLMVLALGSLALLRRRV